MERADEAYYLQDLELAVLLSLKGEKELYGFRMERIKEAGTAEVYRTLFDLGKKRLLILDEKDDGHALQREAPRIAPELDRMLEVIRDARMMLWYRNGEQKHADRCIYLTDAAVMISGCSTGENLNRLSCVPLNRLPGEVMDGGFFLDELVSDGSLFTGEEIEQETAAEAAERLYDGAEKADGSAWEGVENSLRWILTQNGKCVRQYLLIRNGMDSYFVITDESGSRVYPYSKKQVIDTFEADLVTFSNGRQVQREEQGNDLGGHSCPGAGQRI